MRVSRLAVVAAVSLSAMSPLMAKDLYRCVVVESRHATDDGKLETYPRDVYAGSVILVDTQSGLVRLFGNPFEFEVVQAGSTQNSWILMRRARGPASTSVHMLVVKVYRPAIPFVMTDSLMTYSGNCRVVQ